MDNNPDEIILGIMNELQLGDVLSMRLLNMQLYRCSFNAVAFINRIVGMFMQNKISEKGFDIARKIPGFDFTINNNYAIRWASTFGYLQHVEFLKDRCVNIHVNKDWPLQLACLYGHIDIVRCLMKHGADINADNGWALQLACEKGHLDIVKYIVDNGADIHIKNNQPLRLAAVHGNIKIVSYLVDRGADISIDNYYCFKKGTPNVAEYLESLIKKN